MKYSEKGKNCEDCEDKFFLSDNQLNCIADLVGVTNCLEYNSPTECKKCNSGFFLDGSECKVVQVTSQIKNCLIYDSGQLCEKCQKGYMKNADG